MKLRARPIPINKPLGRNNPYTAIKRPKKIRAKKTSSWGFRSFGSGESGVINIAARLTAMPASSSRIPHCYPSPRREQSGFHFAPLCLWIVESWWVRGVLSGRNAEPAWSALGRKSESNLLLTSGSVAFSHSGLIPPLFSKKSLWVPKKFKAGKGKPRWTRKSTELALTPLLQLVFRWDIFIHWNDELISSSPRGCCTSLAWERLKAIAYEPSIANHLDWFCHRFRDSGGFDRCAGRWLS